MLLAVLPQRAFALWTDEGNYDISWYDGSGSYTISTPQQLAGVSYLVEEMKTTFEGEIIYLGADIDLSGNEWWPIGTAHTGGSVTKRFRGTFDGQDHKITGLYINGSGYYKALFGGVVGATLKNFEVHGQVTGAVDCAGVCAFAQDSSFTDVDNYVDVTATYPWNGRAAGVVLCSSTAYPTKAPVFKNLTNHGTINGTSYQSGGVLGFIYTSGEYETAITLCANYGDVSISNSQNASSSSKAAGGVIGATAGYGTYTISQCMNEGTITTANLPSTGGIVGFLGGAGSSVSSCYNTGAINGPSSSAGIVGRYESTGGISDCYSSGDISGSNAAAILASSAYSTSESAQNNYFLEGSAPGAFAGGTVLTGSGESKTYDEFQTQDILDLLNTHVAAFARAANLNNGLPVLAALFGLTPGSGGIVPSADEPGGSDTPDPGEGGSEEGGSGDNPQPGDDPQPQPEPQPGAGDDPEPQPGDDPQPQPEPGADDNPEPQPGTDPKPEPEPEPQPEPEPEPQPIIVPETDPQPEPQPQVPANEADVSGDGVIDQTPEKELDIYGLDADREENPSEAETSTAAASSSDETAASESSPRNQYTQMEVVQGVGEASGDLQTGWDRNPLIQALIGAAALALFLAGAFGENRWFSSQLVKPRSEQRV